MTAPQRTDRKWELRKDKFSQVLEQFDRDSPNMRLLAVEDAGDEVRAMVEFDTVTLVRPPGGNVQFRGPVLTGIRYHHRFLSIAPIPWEIVTILSPRAVFHPNVNEQNGLCLWHPQANIPLQQILHTTWAALVLNTRLVNTVDCQVFNHNAAAYVRAEHARFPLTERGLLESAGKGGKPDGRAN